jgi:hypothetical protein
VAGKKMSFNSGANMEACNFQPSNSGSGSMGLVGEYILCHIMFDLGLPLVQLVNLWAPFYFLLILFHELIPKDSLASQTAAWNHIHCLFYIDNALASRKFHKLYHTAY